VVPELIFRGVDEQSKLTHSLLFPCARSLVSITMKNLHDLYDDFLWNPVLYEPWCKLFDLKKLIFCQLPIPLKSCGTYCQHGGERSGSSGARHFKNLADGMRKTFCTWGDGHRCRKNILIPYILILFSGPAVVELAPRYERERISLSTTWE